MTTLKDMLKATGHKTTERLGVHLGQVGWVGATELERATWMRFQTAEVKSRANRKMLGDARLVSIKGIPVAWTDTDDYIHGGCRFPDWTG